MTKSALVGIIHHQAIGLPSATHNNSEAVTLMSNDAEGLDGVAEMVHEIWAQMVEVVIGIVLLSREVGWIWPLSLILIFCTSTNPCPSVLLIPEFTVCSRMSRYVAKHLGPRQKAWNTATQERVAATSSMLSAMRVIKMLGLQRCMARFTCRLREDELATASKVRWIMVYYNASGLSLAPS